MTNYFNKGTRPNIICEIEPAASPLLNVSLEELNNYMKQYDYKTFLIKDLKNIVDIIKLRETESILFSKK